MCRTAALVRLEPCTDEGSTAEGRQPSPLLALYLAVQSSIVLATGHHADVSPLGMAWTAVTALIMFALAAGKARTGRALDNVVLRTEGRVTLVDGLLAVAVLVGLVLNALIGWWWADPMVGYVLALYAPREVRAIYAIFDTEDLPT